MPDTDTPAGLDPKALPVAPAYYTLKDLAHARGVPEGTIRQAVQRNRARARTHPDKAWPKVGVPQPDEGRPLLRWLADRPDVIAYMSADRTRYPQLADVNWLRAQYLSPPEGAGRSARNIAKELGCRPYNVTWALDRHAIKVNSGSQASALDGVPLAELEGVITRCGSQKAAAKHYHVSENTLRRARCRARLEASQS